MASMPARLSRAQTRRACSAPWGDSGGSPCPPTSGNGLPSTYASDWPCRTSTSSTAPGGGSNRRCRNEAGSGPGCAVSVTRPKSYRPPGTANPEPAPRGATGVTRLLTGRRDSGPRDGRRSPSGGTGDALCGRPTGTGTAIIGGRPRVRYHRQISETAAASGRPRLPPAPARLRRLPPRGRGSRWSRPSRLPTRGLGRRQELRHDHAPRLDDELAHLGRAEPGHAHVDPVEAPIAGPVQEEPVRLGGDHRGALLAREGKAHDRLVRGDRGVDDLPDPELHVVADQVLLRAGQRQRDLTHLLRGYHRLGSSA